MQTKIVKEYAFGCVVRKTVAFFYLTLFYFYHPYFFFTGIDFLYQI